MGERGASVWLVLGCATSMAMSALACTTVLGDFDVSSGSTDAGNDATTDATTSDSGADRAVPLDAPDDARSADAGDAADSSDGYNGPCGDLAQPCCAGDTCNDPSFGCNAGYCRPRSSGDLGKPCTLGSECASGVCLPVGQPQGGTGGWTGSVCTQPCSDGGGCASGWTCAAQGSAGKICKCSYTPETCNSLDDDCDGTVDNEPAVDSACQQQTRSPLFQCKQGSCACTGLVCNGTCIDPKSDPKNCNGYGNDCASNATCNNGSCACPGNAPTDCNHNCVDTTSNPSFCGGCGVACVSGQTCIGSRCACPQGQAVCGPQCIDITSDPRNCGNCNVACPVGGQICNQQNCQCPAATPAVCDNTCVDTMSNSAHCGGCDSPCSGNQICQGGGCTCPSGLTVCANKTCIDLNSDPKNCGACGHDCGGASCTSGLCQPVLLCSATSSSMAAVKVALSGNSAFFTATGAAADGKGNIYKCPLNATGSIVTPLVTNQDGVSSIAVDAANGEIDWVAENLGTANHASQNGGAVAVIASGQSNPFGMAVDAADWWWGASDRIVREDWRTGAQAPWIVGGQFFWEIAVDGTNVYGADLQANRVVACAKQTPCTAAPTVIASGLSGPRSVFSDGSNVWIGTQGTSNDGAVYKCAPAGCTPTASPPPFAANQGNVQVVRADASGVYWFSNQGLVTCPIAGCPAGGPRVLTVTYSTALALDATFAYYAVGGNLYRIAR